MKIRTTSVGPQTGQKTVVVLIFIQKMRFRIWTVVQEENKNEKLRTMMVSTKNAWSASFFVKQTGRFSMGNQWTWQEILGHQLLSTILRNRIAKIPVHPCFCVKKVLFLFPSTFPKEKGRDKWDFGKNFEEIPSESESRSSKTGHESLETGWIRSI